MVDALSIVFFGTPAFAVPTLERLLDSRHPVRGVVTQPDRPQGRGQRVSESPVKRVALAHRVPVIQPERLRDPAVLETLRGWAPDLGVVAAYGKLIPENVLTIPRHGTINVHASLLPKYRGAAPVHRAVIDGEPETGVTIMRVEKMLDAGPMLARAVRPVGPDETSDVIERDLAQRGAALLVEVVGQIAAGTAREELQDFMLCTYAPKITKEEGLIDWTLPASFIHNRVRGLHPWPHAYTYLNGARIIVLTTHVETAPASAPPGTIVHVSRQSLQVATGHEGRLAIERLQLEGRRPMTVQEFLAGHTVKAGERFANS
ncbi:MAG: methionyl-tRNA formyltransferase [Acidobacteria bacterium RIFCSPLOWO2_02_FULL_67_21]|nr:MAG: methionyl-tRNA formyltransferase [Acidobacteria bacterium RIFCSPLOWO2_02_FULL_67_21]